MKKNETLHSLLTHIGQNAARPEEIDLWPSIQARLAAGNYRTQHGEFTMQTNPVRKPDFRVAVIGALTILFALGILLGLPQGRAWAQGIMHFSTEARAISCPALQSPRSNGLSKPQGSPQRL